MVKKKLVTDAKLKIEYVPIDSIRPYQNNLRDRQRTSECPGFPVRSAEETAIRYEICLGCDKFIDGKCSICGCPVRKKRGMLIKKQVGTYNQAMPAQRWVEMAAGLARRET
jgi:hypothetical protein